MKTTLVALGAAVLLTINISCANKTESSGASGAASEGGSLLAGGRVYPLLWENQSDQGRNWTAHIFDLIQQQTPDLIQGAEDVTQFCPRYYQLTTYERINFWGLLVSGIVKYESGFDPTDRMREPTMGIDPVTGKPVYSEGLMQLSYQDSKAYPFCDEFNWSVDKNLHPTDPRKSILDPYKNLNCGVKILAHQIRYRNRITLSNGVYWAVLQLNGSHNKINSIAALTKRMPGCMN